VIGSRHSGFALRASRFGPVPLAAVAFTVSIVAGASSEEAALSLRATVVPPARGTLTVTLFRWSTDAERAPLAAALSAPAAAPAARAGYAAGRGGRGGRAGGAPPASPAARFSTAVKAAPTLGYIWGDGVTGYSIKFAWRSSSAGRGFGPAVGDHVVLITDRRLGAHAPEWGLASGPTPDAEYTLIEIRFDASGTGEAKTSLSANVALDPVAQTPVLDGYAAAPAQFRITR
jgi:hypothetical protein